MKTLVLLNIPALISDMRKFFLEYAKCFVILLIVAGLFSCDNQSSSDELEKVEFCLYLNMEDVHKTIPIVNEFLANQSNSLSDEEKLQALATWLKSCPCIIDAAVFRTVFSSIMQKTITEISISFNENGVKKELALDILMNNPLEAIGFHELYHSGQISVVTKTFFTMDMMFDFINSFEHEVLYITGVCYISTMPSDNLLYVAHGIRAKPYVVGLAYALHFMTNAITLNFWLYDMKNSDYQADWLKTINDYQLVEVMNEERYEGYNIILNVPEGTEREWEGKFMKYEFVESVRLAYFTHN